MASLIFPYLLKNEVLGFINDAAEILAKSGILYISTMLRQNFDSGYKGPSNGDQMCMNYHEVTYLEKAMIDSGFVIVSSTIQSYDYGGDTNGTDIIIIRKLKT